jgi:arylsulfatase A-like enzyme
MDENKNRPFFLYVPFNIPHYPEQAVTEFAKLYADVENPARRSYGTMVSTTDHYIGRVIDKLEVLGLRESTIVIFMSDNGHSEETKYTIQVDNHNSGYPKGHFYGASGGGNTGKWIGNKSTFLEGGIRVPAIISCPTKLPQGEVRDQIVTAMDWYPTVLDLCGIEQPGHAPALDGHSLLPIIQSADTESNYKGVLHFAWGNTWAVRDGDWKLIGLQPKNGNKAKVSLHNLADANPEVNDYANERPAIVARLTELHNQWDSDVSPR